MKRKIVLSAVAAALVAGGAAGVASAVASPTHATATKGQQVVMQASKDLTATTQGLAYVKLHSATTGNTALGGQVAISSVTIAQFDGSQPLQVALRAASCDNANGFGETEDVVVPQNETVHLDYPKSVLMPFVKEIPKSWCLYAATVDDNGTLMVSAVLTKEY